MKLHNPYIFISLLMFFILSINIASAFEFDNVKNYDTISREVSIKNCNLWIGTCLIEGDTIGKARLNSPLNVVVPIGYQKVAEFDLWAYEDYNDALKQFTFNDLNNGKEKINRDYDLKYLSYEDVEVEDYKTECSEVKYKENETYYNKCYNVLVGTYIEKKAVWKKITPADLKKNEKLTIGVFTEVKKGDYVDWIPSIYGVEVEEWASWTESLNVDLELYYKLDETTGAVDDAHSTNDGTAVNVVQGVSNGKINNMYSFDGDTDYITTPIDVSNYDGVGYSVSFWFKYNDTGDYVMVGQDKAGDRKIAIGYNTASASTQRFNVYDGTNLNYAPDISADTWTHVIVTNSDLVLKIYHNGISVTNGTGAIATPSSINMWIGGREYVGVNSWYKGYIDEVGFWGRVLTHQEVIDIYNNGDGLGYNSTSDNPPSITLNSPSSANYTSPQSLVINFTAWDDVNLTDVKLYVNDALNQTNASGINNSNYLFDLELGDGDYTIYGKATDSESEETNSSSIRIVINTTPNIQFESPTQIDYYNSTSSYIPVNVSLTETYFQNVTFTFSNGTDYTFTDDTRFINYSFDDGSYTYNVTTCTTTNKCNTTETRNITIDNSLPQITINYPTSILNYGYINETLQLNFTINDTNLDTVWHNYPYLGIYNEYGNFNDLNLNTYNTSGNYYMNITKTINNSIFVGRCGLTSGQCFPSILDIPAECSSGALIQVLAELSDTILRVKCYNTTDWITIHTYATSLPDKIYLSELLSTGTEVVGAISGTANLSNISIINNYYNVTVYANDTIGNTNYESINWSYIVFENSVTFNNETISGSQEDYIFTLTLDSSADISSAYLFFGNETLYPSITSSGQNRIISMEDYSVPIYLSDTNVSFYFTLILDDSTEINSSENVQLVRVVLLDNCSSYSTQLFNISLFDEQAKTPLVGDIELNYQLLNQPDYDVVNSANLEFSNVSIATICSDINLSGENFVQSVEFRYVSDGYVPELFHIQRANITNESQQINLYDLNSSFSTEFKITYQDSTFNFVEGAIIQLQRKYISEGIYETVEAPITSSDGTALVHIDTDSIKYMATVVKNGVVLDIFDNLVFKCQSELSGECEQKLLGDINPQNEINLETTLDFAYSEPVLTNDSIIVYFSIPSGSPSEINIVLEQKDEYGNKTLCNRTILSSAGSISCDYSETLGRSYIDLSISKSGSVVAKKSYVLEFGSGLDWLGNNYIFIFILLLSLVGMALSSPEWMIINGIVTMVISGGLYLARGLDFVVGLGSIVWLVIASIILISKLSKQEDR